MILHNALPQQLLVLSAFLIVPCLLVTFHRTALVTALLYASLDWAWWLVGNRPSKQRRHQLVSSFLVGTIIATLVCVILWLAFALDLTIALLISAVLGYVAQGHLLMGLPHDHEAAHPAETTS